jgi:hypothetical protein
MSRQKEIRNAMHWLAFHLEVIERMNAVAANKNASRGQHKIARDTAVSSNKAFKEQRRLLLHRYNVPIGEIRKHLPAFRNSVGRKANEAVDAKLRGQDRPTRRRSNQGGNAQQALRAAIGVVVSVANSRIKGGEWEPQRLKDTPFQKQTPIGYGAYVDWNFRASFRVRLYNVRLETGGFWGMTYAASTKVTFRAALIGSIGIGFGLKGVPGFKIIPERIVKKLSLDEHIDIIGKVEAGAGLYAEGALALGVHANRKNGRMDPKVQFKMAPEGSLLVGGAKLKLEFPKWLSGFAGLLHELMMASPFKDIKRYNSVLEYKFFGGFKLAYIVFPRIVFENPHLSSFRANPLQWPKIVQEGIGYSFSIHPHVINFCKSVRNRSSKALERYGQIIQQRGEEMFNSLPAVRFYNWANQNLFN